MICDCQVILVQIGFSVVNGFLFVYQAVLFIFSFFFLWSYLIVEFNINGWYDSYMHQFNRYCQCQNHIHIIFESGMREINHNNNSKWLIWACVYDCVGTYCHNFELLKCLERCEKKKREEYKQQTTFFLVANKRRNRSWTYKNTHTHRIGKRKHHARQHLSTSNTYRMWLIFHSIQSIFTYIHIHNHNT